MIMFAEIKNWFQTQNVRQFSRTVVRFDDPSRLSNLTYTPNNFEKRLLVWFGKYKRVEEVPNLVSPEAVSKARSRMRIRVSNIGILLTAVGCIVMIISGKRARDRGESIQQMNLEWHAKHRADAKAEAEAKSK